MLIVAYKNRALVKTLTLKDKDGDAITLGSGDVIRVKIGHAGSTPLLDLNSTTATSGGSSLTFANPTTMFLHQTDMNSLSPGRYDIEVSLVDHSQSDAIKMAEKGVFHLENTQTGSVGT